MKNNSFRKIEKLVCVNCGKGYEERQQKCSDCNGKLVKISMIHNLSITHIFIMLLLVTFSIGLWWNFFSDFGKKETTPIGKLISDFILLSLVISFSYIVLKIGGEWHAVTLSDNGFKIYTGYIYYPKIRKINEYKYSDIEVFCKIITLRYASIVFKANTNDKTNSFVTKKIKIAETIINSLEGKELPSHEFEKRFSVVTGF